MRIDFADIRRLTITALFGDDELFNVLVLKGGNAISLVYNLSVRTSLDVDVSLEEDFPDLLQARTRMFSALRRRFSSVGLMVFDEHLVRRPTITTDETWGGYVLSFKLIEAEKYNIIGSDIDSMRRNAIEIGPGNLRTFTVDISKHEYCTGNAEAELEHYTIRVYTPSMLATEKLRAICQQMSEYKRRRHPTPRARDFFDIHELVLKAGVRFGAAEQLELTRRVFAAKDVPLLLISYVSNQREFHRPDWPAVQASSLW